MKLKRRYNYNISATRDRDTDEITPKQAEQSATKYGNNGLYGAGNAIDMDLVTVSWTVAGTDGAHWLKITLAKVHCVSQVIWYTSAKAPKYTWICTDMDCSNCEDNGCDTFTLTVSTEGAASDLSHVSDCRYGDTVKFTSAKNLLVNELSIIGKQGESMTEHLTLVGYGTLNYVGTLSTISASLKATQGELIYFDFQSP